MHRLQSNPHELEDLEQDVAQLRRRVRDKQKLFLELIKQQVSVTKLKRRNFEMTKSNQRSDRRNNSVERLSNPEEDDQSAPHKQKLPLPLLFVECQPGSRIKISQDDTKRHLKLRTDLKFTVSDENFLFDCMGLTKTTSEELRNMFNERIIDFLQQNQLVKNLPVRQDDQVSNMSAKGFTKDIEVTNTYQSKRDASYDTPLSMKMTGLQQGAHYMGIGSGEQPAQIDLFGQDTQYCTAAPQHQEYAGAHQHYQHQ